MLPSVSIIGLGWLGEPLAQHLLLKGYKVSGSVTSEEKRLRMNEAGIDTRILRVGSSMEGMNFEELFLADVVVINIPPAVPPSAGNQNLHEYAQQVAALRDLAIRSGVKKIIFVSATSVYPDNNGVVTESDVLTIENTASPSIFLAEQEMRSSQNYLLTIVRMGGLIGGGRIPGKHFSGRDNVAGHPPVNYIYRDDAVRLLAWVIENEVWGELFNGVAPMHPTRRAVYERNASRLGFGLPASYENPPATPWKEISSDKLTQAGFTFSYPDPLQFPL